MERSGGKSSVRQKHDYGAANQCRKRSDRSPTIAAEMASE
jgi:hypothetical protein